MCCRAGVVLRVTEPIYLNHGMKAALASPSHTFKVCTMFIQYLLCLSKDTLGRILRIHSKLQFWYEIVSAIY